MGNYNPHAPQIIGEEWAPIRQPGLLPNAVTEVGYTTSIDHTAVVVSGAFYVQNPPPAFPGSIAEILAVYAAGTENDTGPIRQVIIRCDGVTATGTGTGGNPGLTPGAVQNPSDFEFISISPIPAGTSQQLGLSFDVSSYTAELNGKRILNVELLYTAAGLASDFAETNVSIGRASALSNGEVGYEKLTGSSSLGNGTQINSMSFGELNVFHTSTVVAPGVPFEPWAYPWRYTELALLDASATPLNQKLIVVIQNQGNVSDILIGYVALRVTYCEEQRVAYGAMRSLSALANTFDTGYHYVPLRTPAFASSVSLTQGAYTVVQSLENLGGTPSPYSPNLSALQELYAIPTLSGMQVNRSLVVDTTFTTEYSDVIPALSLHTTAAIVTGSHVYGVRIGAPVYTGVNVTQEIDMRNAPASSTDFPQVRFYARRFGDTTGDLTITETGFPTVTASITVAEFDALPEIIDGWKEVTLRFTSPAVFIAAAAVEDFVWSSTTSVSSQWQVLGGQVPAPNTSQAPGAATYLAPFGATDRLTWKEPNDSAPGADTTADATLIISQDPPIVSGFAVTQAFQSVASVGLNCGTPNGCIPTGIGYNQVAWTPIPISSMQATGFGYYELDRYDSIDVDWQTIMTASSIYVSGFADYEARVGQQSWYRMRARNVLDFAGAWVTGSGTIATPGVQITGDGNSVLIFTSNVGPTGNLAYTMTWDSRPIESFVFPEADTVQLQRMFGKNFMTAFRPLERGGDRFQRTILVNAAAIALPSLANFSSLRNLAWADLPYVCVRDELGNRWFATIIVPSGDVQVNRQIYLAQIDVVETSETPYPVDPA